MYVVYWRWNHLDITLSTIDAGFHIALLLHELIYVFISDNSVVSVPCIRCWPPPPSTSFGRIRIYGED
jgi:hypothetical protein